MAQEALLLQAGLQRGAPCVPLSWWGAGKQAGQRAVCSHGLPTLTLTQWVRALTLALRAEHKHPLAGDDLKFVVLAATGHLNGSQRDHTLGEGVLERQPSDPQRRELSHVC